MKKVVLASHNAGKIKEFGELLRPLHLDLLPQSAFSIPEAEEAGLTFVENALLKARLASRFTGLPAIADDSGLSVFALSGAPGIHSARFAGTKSSAHDNIKKLLAELESFPFEERKAYFYCVIVFILKEDDPIPLICEGKWEGIILSEPRGQQGFGYDPVFYVPSEQKTAAELSLAVKNKISHRGIAMQLLKIKLSEK